MDDLTPGSGRARRATVGGSPPGEYRIGEVAALAGTTVRNVRAYQDRGLLRGPRRVGRIGLYSDAHLGRLRVIAELLGRGYSLSSIGELLAGWEQGRDLSDLLGLEAALIGGRVAERPRCVTRGQVAEALGEAEAAALIDGAVRAGMAEVDGATVRVDNPRMLDAAAVLIGAGVPATAVVGLGAWLVAAVDEIALRYVDVVAEHLVDPRPDPLPDAEVRSLAALVQRLRPLASGVIDAELALALERRIQMELGDRVGRARRAEAG